MAKALYADMGHFGHRSIKWAWFAFFFPLLYLNYLGQGALILSDPKAIDNPFFLMVSTDLLLIPLVVLATIATVIASQAVISGAFSLTSQAIQLGYCPRIMAKFTSALQKGQIYVSNINWLLLLTVIAVVLGFGSSSNLASAYGIAVTLTMMIDTILALVVVRALWKWSWPRAALFLVFFVAVDFAFFSANAIKIYDGGWLPLTIGLSVFTLLVTWNRGRKLLSDRLQRDSVNLKEFMNSATTNPPHCVDGTGVFLTSTADPKGVPRPLLHNLKHNKVLHKRIVLLHVTAEDVPHVPEDERVRMVTLSPGFHRMLVSYGFMDDPNVPGAMELCEKQGFSFDLMETSFFPGNESVVRRPVSKSGASMLRWHQMLFGLMFRAADPATVYFKIPHNCVVELGSQVEV